MDEITKTRADLDLSALPKPDFQSVRMVDLSSLIENLGERSPESSGKKPKAGEALNLNPAALAIRRKVTARKVYDLTKSKRAIEQIVTLPAREEAVHCIMGGDYDGFDVVIAVQSLAGAPVDELHIATLGFNRYNIAQLCAMLDAGAIANVGLLCSEYFSSADKTDFIGSRDMLHARGQRLVATRNHAKVLLFAIGSLRYVVESSANLRSCNNLEQFCLTELPDLYAFHRQWIEHCLANG